MGVVKQQGITNTLVIYLGTLIGAGSLLVVQPLFLSKEELGLTRLILSFGTVLASILSFGISSVTVRYLPRVFDPEKKHRGFFGFLLLYVTTSVFLGIILLLVLRPVLGRLYGGEGGIFQENFLYVIVLAASCSFVLGFNAYALALMRSVFPTFLNDVIVRLLFMAIIALHFIGVLDLHGFLLSFCGIYGVQALVMLVYIAVVGRTGLIPDLAHMRETIGLRPILRYGAVITFTAINSVSLKYLDSIFVGRVDVEDVAIYSVAAFIGLMIEVPLNALERIANPAVAHAMAANDMGPIRIIYQRSARLLLLLGGWMFILVILNVRDVLGLLPEGYAEGWPVAMVIAFGALINMATGINYPILANSDRYIYGSMFLVILLLLTILGNWLLIPQLGMMGAAVTACIANVVYNSMKFEFIRRRYGLQPFDRSTGLTALLIAGCCLAFAFVPLPFEAVVNILLRTVGASLLFLAVVVRLRLFVGLEEYLPAFIKNRLVRATDR